MRLLVLLAVLLAPALAGCFDGATAPPDAGVAATALSLACAPPCRIEIDRGTRWEPAVAVDPRDGARMVAASMDQGYQGARYSWPLAHVSHDGGGRWTTARLPMGPEAGPAHPLAGYNHADDPHVLFLADGTLLYTALVFHSASNVLGGFAMSAPGIALWRSSDGGLTFPEASVLYAGRGVQTLEGPSPDYLAHDKQWLTQGADGSVLMVWNTNEDGTQRCGSCTHVWAAASRDGGRTWPAEPSLVYAGVASGAFPLILDDGTWVVSYRETRDALVHVAVSNDQGASWTTNTTIDSTTKFPMLAKTSGPAGARVHMVYPMSAEHDGQPDVPQEVRLRWSDDGARTWSAPVVLAASDAHARTSPTVAAGADGGALVTYWHPAGEGDALHADLRAVAVAADGAVSPTLTLDTHEGTTRTTGDYMGIAPLPGGEGAFAVWNARRGDQHVVSGARLVLA